MRSYPHMCRDGHQEIGHADSENELCPLCRAFNARDRHREDSAMLNGLLREVAAERDALRGLLTNVVAAARHLLAYEVTGAPDFPDWERHYDALRAAVQSIKIDAALAAQEER